MIKYLMYDKKSTPIPMTKSFDPTELIYIDSNLTQQFYQNHMNLLSSYIHTVVNT